MPKILAIDTSTELASVALLHDGQLLAREASGVQTHSQNVLPMAQALLTEAGLRLADCDAIAFGVGPGSFTGVRTACGVAQGLGFGSNLPLVPVVTLLAIAEACRESGGGDDFLVLLDARMEEVYWAQYRHAGDWQVIVPPTLSAPSAVAPAGSPVACGNGLAAYPDAFGGLRQSPEKAMLPHASHIARLAVIEVAAGRTISPRDAQPVYLRNKVALTTAERLAKSAA